MLSHTAWFLIPLGRCINYLAPMFLNFLIHKMGWLFKSAYFSCLLGEITWVNTRISFRIVPSTQKVLKNITNFYSTGEPWTLCSCSLILKGLLLPLSKDHFYLKRGLIHVPKRRLGLLALWKIPFRGWRRQALWTQC